MTYQPFTSPAAQRSQTLTTALVAAEDAVARLDERLATSPIREGFFARGHFIEACASQWAEGELVTLEDLVLHDAAMDVRSPTAELVAAQNVLRARRRIAAAAPGWASSQDGLCVLRGRASQLAGGPTKAPAKDAIESEDEHFAAELAAIDAVIARSSQILASQVLAGAPRLNEAPASLPDETFDVYAQDWDEEDRLATWRADVVASSHEPPILAAAVAAERWHSLNPLQHASWLGRLLVPDLLRQRGKTRTHLLCLSAGLKGVPRDRRRSANPTTRLLAWIDAMRQAADQGLRDHDRWLAAKRQLEHRIGRRRSTSNLPNLIDLVIATPIVSTALIAKQLDVTPRAAQMLAKDLGLREMTGRGRYRAWGVI